MPRRTSAVQDIISRQERMLRLAERDHDLTLEVLAQETGIPKGTLNSYKKGVAMPQFAFALLCEVIPDDLTSLLLPTGKYVSSEEPEGGDLDALAREAAGFNVEYLEAHHPGSEGGTTVTPRERQNLKDRARRMSTTARAAAA